MSIGAILQITAFGVPQMIIGRVVGGIGNGMNTATAPVWQSETSQVKWRGKLVVLEMILNIAGFSISNWVTYGTLPSSRTVRVFTADNVLPSGFSFLGGPISWRFPLAFQYFFIFILYGTTPWLPESPR